MNVLDDEAEQVAVPHVDQRPNVSPIEVLRKENEGEIVEIFFTANENLLIRLLR